MTRTLCPKLCRECPFKRTSAPGYLGEVSGDPWEFLRAHYIEGEMPLPCHMTVRWEGDDIQERAAKAPVCRGYMTFLRNTMRIPKDPEMAELYMRTPSDRGNVFSTLNEFLTHHHNAELAQGFRRMRS